MRNWQTSTGASSLQIAKWFEEIDRRSLQEAKQLARPLTDQEYKDLEVLKLPPRKDYSDLVTLVYDQVGGGCENTSLLGIMNILSELECRYSPDLSMRFGGDLHNEINFLHRDPRIRERKLDHFQRMAKYGCCSEATRPSTVFAFPDPDPVSDRALEEAKCWRVQSWSDLIRNPDTQTIKKMLYLHGPVVATSRSHAYAIIGYDDDRGEFTLLNSWADTWGDGGMLRVRYEDIGHADPNDHSFDLEDIRYITLLPNVPKPRFTGRVRIRHIDSRRYLIVKVGAEGQTPAIVWDYRELDGCKNLSFDFPLPDYAEQFWPPSGGHRWTVQVRDSSPGNASDTAAVVEEVTLVERTKTKENTWLPITYRSSTTPIEIQRRGNVKIYVPTPQIVPALSVLLLEPRPSTVPSSSVLLLS